MILKVSKIFSVVFLMLNTVIFAQENAYRIEVEVNNFQGKVCYLGYPYGPKKYLADTAEINSDGKFVFEGSKPLDGGLYFIYSPVPQSLYFDLIVAEPEFSVQTDTLDLITNMKTQGSFENEVFFSFQKFMREKQVLGSELSEQLKNTSDQAEKDELTAQLKSLDVEENHTDQICWRKMPKLLLLSSFDPQ